MKRSELVAMIWEYSDDAEDILSLLEERCLILPPAIVNPKYVNLYPTYLSYIEDKASYGASGSKFEFEDYYLYEWEKEDELMQYV